jgi:C4-type Zn-finger protein
MKLEHRADGWPLCPACGENEVWSATPASVPPFATVLPAGLGCYACNWRSTEPATRGQDPAHLALHAMIEEILARAWELEGLISTARTAGARLPNLGFLAAACS